MKRLSTLALVLVLAFLAVASQAYATTFTPIDPTTGVGTFTANAGGGGPGGASFFGSLLVFTCGASTMKATYQEDGTGHLTTWTFGMCVSQLGQACVVATDVATLGDTTTAGFATTAAGVVTFVAAATMTFNATCAGTTCVYNFDTTNGMAITHGDPAIITMLNMPTTVGAQCVNVKVGTTYNITTVDAGTNTPVPDNTRLTIGA